MRSTAILDAGPLVAALDPRDLDHRASRDVLRRRDLNLVIPALVVAEVAYIAAKQFGSRVEAQFLRGLDRFEVETPNADEWSVIADLVDTYADFPLGTTDAATIVLADRLETDLIVTLDRRRFGAVQSPRGRRFRLLPETIAVHEEPESYEATQA